MDPSMLYTLSATFLISILSLIGFFTLGMNEKTLDKILLVFVAFSAGSILGAALFDLLPEAIELVDEALVFPIISLGFIFFLLLERFLYWYHGHGHVHEFESNIENRPAKEFAYLNLIGDFIHNFIDGMIISASFINGFTIGIATAIAVAFHELPQEMGDYGILVYAGFERKISVILNFVAAFSVVIGGFFGSIFIELVEPMTGWMIAFSVGAFLFLSATELIPEMHKEKDRRKNLLEIVILVSGLLTIYSLGIILPE